jgi:ribonuclease P protein component
VESKKRLTTLRTANDFASLRKYGRTFHPTPWLMVSFKKHEGCNVCHRQNQSKVRCAWTISRKVGPAVIRNRLKRWSREFLRPWIQGTEDGVDFNLIFKPRGNDFYRHLKHSEFNQAITKVVDRFGKA